MISFCAAYQRFHQKITLFLFFYSLVYCNLFCVESCVPIYACLLVVLSVCLFFGCTILAMDFEFIMFVRAYSALGSACCDLCVCTSCAYTGLGFELFVWTLVADFCELCSHVKVVPSMMLLLCWIVCPGCSGIRSRIP